MESFGHTLESLTASKSVTEELLKRRAALLTPDVGPILLSQGHIAIVDADLLEHFARWSWYTHASNLYKSEGRTAKLYAARSVYAGMKNGKPVTRRRYPHREVMMAQPGDIVAHVNDVSLDCRRANLKRTTQADNMAMAAGPEFVEW